MSEGAIGYTWKQAQGYTPGRTMSIACVLLHSTDGHKEGDIDTLTGDHVSVHWYVDKAGEYYHFVQDADTAWHAGIVDNPMHSNAATIGIEQEHIDGEEDWPDTLVNATANLVAAIYQKHGISKYRFHKDVATFTMNGSDYGRKVDPQDYPADFGQRVAAAMQTTWTFQQIASE